MMRTSGALLWISAFARASYAIGTLVFATRR